MRRRTLDVEVSATLGGIQEPGILSKLVGSGKAVYRPRLSARPTRIIAPSLVSCLSQKFAGFDVKEAPRAKCWHHPEPNSGAW